MYKGVRTKLIILEGTGLCFLLAFLFRCWLLIFGIKHLYQRVESKGTKRGTEFKKCSEKEKKKEEQ